VPTTPVTATAPLVVPSISSSMDPGSTSASTLPTVTARNTIGNPRVRMGHLLRRAGFGASRRELDVFLEIGEEKTVSFLLEYGRIDDTDLDKRLTELNLDPVERHKDLQQTSLIRMVYTKRPLQEKMVLFWHGLLTSAWRKVGRGPYMLDQDELFRQHAMSPYDGLLKAVSMDPAMLIWLDSRVNKKDKPNENFARELMELFSMGVGTFTEDDVKASARAFTGWSLRKKAFFFEEHQHDFGMKTFLGNTGNYDGNDIIDIIMKQPLTSRFISTKLFEFFAFENPEPQTISRLSKIFNDAGYSIQAVVKEILTSEEFYSDRAYRTKIKSPAELVAGTIRSLDIETNAKNVANNYLTSMGQELFNPFDVSGWPDGKEWINSSTLLNRLNFGHAITRAVKLFDYDLIVPLQERDINTSEQIVDYFVDLLLDGVVSEQEKSILVGYLDRLVNSGSEQIYDLRKNKWKLRSLIYLIMASPDYQLA